MNKILFLILFFVIVQNINSQIQPPGGLTVNNGGLVYYDSITIFNWDDVTSALYYRMQVSTVLDSNHIPVSQLIVPPYTFSPNTYYYWRVNATGPSGTSGWTGYSHFTTSTNIPNPPSLISPPNDTINVLLTPMLDWSDESGALSYRLQISTSPGFSNYIINIAGLSNSGYVIPSGILANCTKYYWRVNATNSGGNSNWSAVWTFKTICQIGINQISSEIPSEYKLCNNYPNPFNPNTIIRFQIKDLRFVSLIIYDLLGKEISRLVNEKKQPGIYEVTFDGSNLPSGIYYYTIHSGDFTDTKRMVLVK